MKHLLNILGTLSLTTLGASSVIACGDEKTKSIKEPSTTSVVQIQPKLTPVENDTQIKLIEDIKNEKQLKMNYFNKLNSKIQKNITELVKKINILESENKNLEQKQTTIKEENEQLQQDIKQLNSKVGKNGNEAMEFTWQKRLKIAENDKNYKILELITKQIAKNKTEIQQLKTQIKQEKFYISEITISSPTKIIVPITQQNENKIYAMEKDINKIVLNQLQEKINNNIKEYDFIIEFESKYINHTGTLAIELSNPRTIKIKIHGKNNIIGETGWISINLPRATIKNYF